jgi:hypothetical protein
LSASITELEGGQKISWWGTFIEGLRAEIRQEVKAQRSRTITAAFSIARVQEERLGEENCKTTKVVNKMAG